MNSFLSSNFLAQVYILYTKTLYLFLMSLFFNKINPKTPVYFLYTPKILKINSYLQRA